MIRIYDFCIDDYVEIDPMDVMQVIDAENPDHIFMRNMDDLYYEFDIKDAIAAGLITDVVANLENVAL